VLNVPNSIVFFGSGFIGYWFRVHRLLGCLVDHRRSKLNLMARLTSSIFFALIRAIFFPASLWIR
jgi:hypothetical protein